MPDPKTERDFLRAALIVAVAVCAILAIRLHGVSAEREAANAHVMRLLEGIGGHAVRDRDHL